MNPEPLKRWNAPDRTDIERENEELNQALWRALSPLRGEDSDVDGVESFTAEVQSKIAAKEMRMRQAPGYARKAAAFLPPFLLPKALAPLATTGGKSSASFFPGLAALPVLAFATLIFSGFAFLRYVFHKGRHDPQESDRRNSALEVADWWRGHIWKVLLVFAGIMLLAFHKPLEAVVLSLALSSLALFGLLTALASAGFATRREVGRVAYQFLYFAALFGWQFIQNDVFGFHHQVGHAWVVPILVISAATCFGLIQSSRKAWWLAALVSTLVIGGIRMLDSRMGKQPIDVKAAIAILSDPERAPDFNSVANWTEYAKAQQHLRAAGFEMPPWEGLIQGMQDVLQASLAEGDFNSLYALDMMEAGALRPEDVEELKSAYTWETMFDPRKYYSPRSDDVQVRMRLLSTELTAEQKLIVADRISKKLQPDTERLNLENLMVGVRTLELLGHADRIPALQPLAHQVLRSQWQRTRDGSQANFVSYPTLVQRDEDGQMSADRLTFIHAETTALAVEAFRYWGVPEGIELKPLHDYLQEMAETYHPKEPGAYSLLAEAARLELLTRPEYQASLAAPQPASPWSWFLDHRLLLASLLLSVGGVWSTWRAPR